MRKEKCNASERTSAQTGEIALDLVSTAAYICYLIAEMRFVDLKLVSIEVNMKV
jgi:hypothetical protein